MIIDGLLLFDSASAVPSTAVSSNTIDLANFRDLGVGDKPAMKLVVQVTTFFTSSTTATTLQVAVTGGTTTASFTTMALSPTLASTRLTSSGNRIFDIDLPRVTFGQAYPRFLQLAYTVANGPWSAGALTAFLCLDRDDIPVYAPGIAIQN